MQGLKGYILIIVSMLLWGSVGIFGRLTGEPSEIIVFYRVGIAFVVLAVWWIWRGFVGWKKIRANWKLAVASGVALGLNWYFFFAAVQKTTVANAVLSYYTAPIIVTILSPFLLKEQVEKRTVVALLFGFIGILVMMVGPQGALQIEDLTGIGFGLAAALFYALLTITGKVVDLPSRLFVLVQTAISALIFLPYGINHPFPTGESLFYLVIIGVIHTALALNLYFTGVKYVKVQHVGILGYLDPLSAIVFALLFLGEIPGSASIIGGGFILFSSYLILRQKIQRGN